MLNFEDPWPENEMDDDWNDGEQQPMNFRNSRDYRNRQYMQAYGNYTGGYADVGMRRERFHPYGPPPPPPPPPPRGPTRGPPRLRGPPGPPPPHAMFGRGFGPRGPPRGPPGGPPRGPPRGPPMRPKVTPQQKTVNYLIRCGMAKDNLKNVPPALLNLIRPEDCGICGMNFESFATSRIHYGSKNHLKNHKKWLTQFGQGRWTGQPTKEVPMKSRELYCELCDVHITSKVNADAHYAGKQHRAVVEGRKLPKNPFLLQPGMQGRLDQLIRREKKHVRPAEVVVTEEMTQQARQAKPGPPELYCDICKTSVTNTEQMTMHLNGKRHLTKEKQHILKMMKGGVKNVDEDDDGITDLTADDAPAQEVVTDLTGDSKEAEGNGDEKPTAGDENPTAGDDWPKGQQAEDWPQETAGDDWNGSGEAWYVPCSL